MKKIIKAPFWVLLLGTLFAWVEFYQRARGLVASKDLSGVHYRRQHQSFFDPLFLWRGVFLLSLLS